MKGQIENLINRGDVILVDLGTPAGGSGHEQAGRRPVTVISLGNSDPENPMITVVPLTGKTEKSRFPHTMLVNPSSQNGLTVNSVLMAFQVTSIDKRRVLNVLGSLENDYMEQLEQLIRNLMQL